MKIIQSFNHSIRFFYPNLIKVTFLATFFLFVTSCRLEEDIILESESPINTEGQTKLGKKLENPYTVENMRKAQENLRAGGQNNNLDVRTTHLYIRFKPRDEGELDLLNKDSTLTFYDYPLDQEIEEGGSYYRDPEVPVGQPTYQYVAVKVDKKLPRQDYELLAELYIPEEDENLNGRTSSSFSVGELVDEALRITNNLTDETPKVDKNVRRANDSWEPAGRIRVWDGEVGSTTRTTQIFDHWEYYPCDDGDITIEKIEEPGECKRAIYRNVTTTTEGSYVPVVGAEVRARRWFTTYISYTDALGNYSSNSSFKRDANYSLRWERYQFSIRSGTFGQATDNGPKKTGDWNRDYGIFGSTTVGDDHQYYALIFQGAHDYYYGNRFGLASPPTNGTFKPQIKISASKKDKASHAASYTRLGGVLPSIYVRKWNDPSDEVYAVTTHELAHASHWDMDRAAFRLLVLGAYGEEIPLYPFTLLPDGARFEAVIESWPNGVEWRFAQERYRFLFEDDEYEYHAADRNNPNYQDQRLAGFNIRESALVYTSIVVDMIDNENQRFSRGHGNVAFPQDRVSGYSILQVEQGIRGATSWDQWRNNMRNRHNNTTEGNLNELFANWY